MANEQNDWTLIGEEGLEKSHEPVVAEETHPAAEIVDDTASEDASIESEEEEALALTAVFTPIPDISAFNQEEATSKLQELSKAEGSLFEYSEPPVLVKDAVLGAEEEQQQLPELPAQAEVEAPRVPTVQQRRMDHHNDAAQMDQDLDSVCKYLSLIGIFIIFGIAVHALVYPYQLRQRRHHRAAKDAITATTVTLRQPCDLEVAFPTSGAVVVDPSPHPHALPQGATEGQPLLAGDVHNDLDLESRVERLELESLSATQRLGHHDARLASLEARVAELADAVASAFAANRQRFPTFPDLFKKTLDGAAEAQHRLEARSTMVPRGNADLVAESYLAALKDGGDAGGDAACLKDDTAVVGGGHCLDEPHHYHHHHRSNKKHKHKAERHKKCGGKGQLGETAGKGGGAKLTARVTELERGAEALIDGVDPQELAVLLDAVSALQQEVTAEYVNAAAAAA